MFSGSVLRLCRAPGRCTRRSSFTCLIISPCRWCAEYGGVALSSFTMAWGVRAAQPGQTRLLVRLLTITLVLAGVFLGVKFVEYKGEVGRGPAARQVTTGPTEPPPGVDMPSFEKEKEKDVGRRPPRSRPGRWRRSRKRQPPCRPARWASARRLPPATGPTGLSPTWLDRSQLRREVVWHGPEPYNVQLFFGIYFAMTACTASTSSPACS